MNLINVNLFGLGCIFGLANWYGSGYYHKFEIRDGRVNFYSDSGYLRDEWDIFYKNSRYYIEYAGEKGSDSYNLIKNYSGSGDNSFTMEDYFYGGKNLDDNPHFIEFTRR